MNNNYKKIRAINEMLRELAKEESMETVDYIFNETRKMLTLTNCQKQTDLDNFTFFAVSNLISKLVKTLSELSNPTIFSNKYLKYIDMYAQEVYDETAYKYFLSYELEEHATLENFKSINTFESFYTIVIEELVTNYNVNKGNHISLFDFENLSRKY